MTGQDPEYIKQPYGKKRAWIKEQNTGTIKNMGQNQEHSVYVCVLSGSVVSNSLQPHGLWPTRLLCPWDFPSKNIGAGCYFLLQGIFSNHGSNPRLLHLLHWQLDSLPLCHPRTWARRQTVTGPAASLSVMEPRAFHFYLAYPPYLWSSELSRLEKDLPLGGRSPQIPSVFCREGDKSVWQVQVHT